MPGTVGWYVCTAKTTSGEPCKAPAIRGGRVCQAHGGQAPQVRAAAAARIERLVDPAISTLREMMLRGDSHTVRLKAAESVLDRAGIVAEKEVKVDNQVTIRVEYADVITEAKAVVEGEVLAVSYAELPPANGHENAPDQEVEGEGRNGSG